MSEGTAAWVEDEVFPGLNLNRFYLQNSPLSAPLTPLDFGRQGHQYGSWIFFRYLSERFGRGIVARIWRLADDSQQQISAKETETYSMRAVRRAIAREDRDFQRVFADFVRVNLNPAKGYREGSTYPVPPGQPVRDIRSRRRRPTQPTAACPGRRPTARLRAGSSGRRPLHVRGVQGRERPPEQTGQR